jgi:hypothetical protein
MVNTIYSPKTYFDRVKMFLSEYRAPDKKGATRTKTNLRAFFRAIWRIGIKEKGRRYFWMLLVHVTFKYPRVFADAIRMAIYGYHFRKVAEAL